MARSYSHFDDITTRSALESFARMVTLSVIDGSERVRWWGLEAPYGGKRHVHDGLTVCPHCGGAMQTIDDECDAHKCEHCVDGFVAAGMDPTYEPYHIRRARLDAEAALPF